MTVVNPKSISGINSITTGSGSDNLLTIHTSDASNTERFRIDSTGTTKIVTGIVTTLTATTGIVTTLTANTVTSLGAVSGTTGTFSGAVSGTTGTFSDIVDVAGSNSTIRLGNGANRRLMYRSGENDIVLEAASNFFYRQNISDTSHRWYTNGADEKLVITAAGKVGINSTSPSNIFTVESTDNNQFAIKSDDTNADIILADSGGSARIRHTGTNFEIWTGGAAGSYYAQSSGRRVTIDSSGDVGINETGPSGKLDVASGSDTKRGLRVTGGAAGGTEIAQFRTNNGTARFTVNNDVTVNTGNLVIGTSGKGIDFSATSDGTSPSSEVFDDYEEGSYIPTISASGTTYTYSTNYTFRSPHSTSDSNSISYVKIGSMVYLNFSMFWNSSNTIRYLITLPFTAKGSAYALCITPASFQVDVDGDTLGTLGVGNNSTAFDTYRVLKDTGTGGHGNVPLSASSEVYYQICYQAL